MKTNLSGALSRRRPRCVQAIGATHGTNDREGGSMARRGRPGLSAQQKKELWSRWRRGESLSEIGRALGEHAGSIYGVLAASGGITPAARTRSDSVLSLQEREEISRCLAKGLGVRAIAARLRRSPSTVSREIFRNGGRSNYRAARADDRAWARAKR